MLKIYNVKDKQEYLKEVAILTQKEWGKPSNTQAEFNQKILRKIEKIKNNIFIKWWTKGRKNIKIV